MTFFSSEKNDKLNVLKLKKKHKKLRLGQTHKVNSLYFKMIHKNVKKCLCFVSEASSKYVCIYVFKKINQKHQNTDNLAFHVSC